MLNVFVIGVSKIGKTPLAKHIAKECGLKPVSASGWVRARFDVSSTNPKSLIEDITKFSCGELARDPDVCVDHIRRTEDLASGGLVIEGIRNPRDFAILFRPERDVVVLVDYPANPVLPTVFEEDGVAAIRDLVEWHTSMGITARQRVLIYSLDAIEGQRLSCHARGKIPGPLGSTKCWNLDELMVFAGIHVQKLVDAARGASTSAKGRSHAEAIPPFRAWVESKFLHDGDESFTGCTPCHVFAVSSYAGHSPTFGILVDNGAMFSYVPAHRLWTTDPAVASFDPTLDANDLAYANCPADEITVTRYGALADKPCSAYFVRRDRWFKAEYVATIDWPTDNLLLHLLKLENGQVALLPSHKVLFSESRLLPAYKKLRAEFRVEERVAAVCALHVNGIGEVLGVTRKGAVADDMSAYGLPGGAVEEGETPEEAVRRETREETGLDVTSCQPFFRRKENGRLVETHIVEVAGEIRPGKGEGHVRYVTWDVLEAGPFGEYNKALRAHYDAVRGR